MKKNRTGKSIWRMLFTLQGILSFSALIMSGCALVLTMIQLHAERDNKQAAVLPYVQCELRDSHLAADSSGAFRMVLHNDGVGPAYIDQVRIRYGERVYEGDNVAAALQYLAALDHAPACTATPLPTFLPAGQQINWFAPTSAVDAGKILRVLNSPENKLDIIICFSDVYKNKWTYHYRTGKVEVCKSCPEIEPTN